MASLMSCLYPLLAQSNLRYQNALKLFKISMIVAGAGFLIIGIGIAFAKRKNPDREINRSIQRIVGGLVMLLGAGLALYGQLAF